MDNVVDARQKFKHKHYADGVKLFAVPIKARALAAMGALKGAAEGNILDAKMLACAAHHTRALQEMLDIMEAK